MQSNTKHFRSSSSNTYQSGSLRMFWRTLKGGGGCMGCVHVYLLSYLNSASCPHVSAFYCISFFFFEKIGKSVLTLLLQSFHVFVVLHPTSDPLPNTYTNILTHTPKTILKYIIFFQLKIQQHRYTHKERHTHNTKYVPPDTLDTRGHDISHCAHSFESSGIVHRCCDGNAK